MNPNIIRQIKNSDKIYLSFDDGPDSEFTPQIIDLLAKYNVTASFFVIGHAALDNRALINRMVSQGHAIFSHSNDHRYHHYFRSKTHIKQWLRESIDELAQQLGQSSPIFRPPAGVITPPLIAAAEELGIKLVLWQHRFYDAIWPLYRWHCALKINRIANGDIILLHDRQIEKNRPLFLSSLQFFLESLQQKQFAMARLTEKEL